MNIQNEIDELKKQIANLEEKQKGKNKYQIEDMKFAVGGDGFAGTHINESYHAQGRTFATREDAEAFAKWERLHAAMMVASDGWVTCERNWYGRWNNISDKYEADWWIDTQHPNTPYFRTITALEGAIDTILGDDKEFYFTYEGRC